jgi:Na+/proline symporter
VHYGPVAGGIGAVVAGGAWLVLLAAFVAAAGIALEQLSGWPGALCTAVTVAILLLYAMPGGMRAVTATNLAHLAALALLIAVVSVLALDHESTRTPHHGGSFPWGYLVGVILLSAPTTVVAPDVMMGMGALRTLAAARKTLALVVLLLTCGGLLLALLGGRAAHLPIAAASDDVLPRLVSLLLPSAVAPAGLLVLFGAALTGAVAEVMVCTFILNEQVAARRRGHDGSALGVAAIRLQMACIAIVSGGVALADPHVVALVLTAFRVFVPGLVPQAVLALLGQRTRAGAAVASMILGPATCLAVAWARPGWQETPAEPALWGALVAVGILALGHVREAPARFHKQ